MLKVFLKAQDFDLIVPLCFSKKISTVSSLTATTAVHFSFPIISWRFRA
jgi:hypothetical protein